MEGVISVYGKQTKTKKMFKGVGDLEQRDE